MKFGHLDDVNSIDFNLPPDHPVTAKVLNKKPVKKAHVYPGLAEWGNEGFPGKIYPKGTKAKDYLKLYGELFTVVELNATGYRIPGVKQVEGWVNAVPKGFKFCPKVSQPISQVKPLGKDPKALQQFFDAMAAFGDHLGVVFLQLHPMFSAKRFDDLVNFFDLWDHTYPLHVELRHADWFSDPELLEKLFEEMKSRKVGTVITDTPGRRDVLHMAVTTTTAFIRFEGNELHRTDFTRIDDWCGRLKEWFDNGLHTAYFFPHTTTKALTPEMSNHFIAKMNKLLDLDLKPAKIITPKDGMLDL
jgi:uncharacterized protein YecE (DUF72 family)